MCDYHEMVISSIDQFNMKYISPYVNSKWLGPVVNQGLLVGIALFDYAMRLNDIKNCKFPW